MSFLKSFKSLSKRYQFLYIFLAISIILMTYDSIIGFIFEYYYRPYIDSIQYTETGPIRSSQYRPPAFIKKAREFFMYLNVIFLIIGSVGIYKSIKKKELNKLLTLFLSFKIPYILYTYFWSDFKLFYILDFTMNDYYKYDGFVFLLIEIIIIFLVVLVYTKHFKTHEHIMTTKHDAPLIKRLLNYMIDRIFVMLIFISNINFEMYFYTKDFLSLSLSILLFVALYYILTEYIFRQTLGKCITNTIIASSNFSLIRIIKRTLIRFIPFESLGFLFPAKKILHDKLSSTSVENIIK